MQVALRVDANAQMGLGHLMRCVALCQWLEKQGAKLCFFISEETLGLIDADIFGRAEIYSIPECYSYLRHWQNSGQQEISWLIQQPQVHTASLLIIDGYHFSSKYRQQLRQGFSGCILAFDDLNDSGYLSADIIVNSGINAHALGYEEQQPGATLCLGSEYRVLREEFYSGHTQSLAQRNTLLVTFGGSDPRCLTLPVLRLLEDMQFTSPVTVITGAGFTQLDELKSWLFQASLNVSHIHDCKNMADNMRKARFAISAAGGTQYELQRCETPCLLIALADNQRMASEAAAEQGCCELEDGYLQSNLARAVTRTLALWQDESKLNAMQAKAQALNKASSPNNLIEVIAQHL